MCMNLDIKYGFMCTLGDNECPHFHNNSYEDCEDYFSDEDNEKLTKEMNDEHYREVVRETLQASR